jgi:tripartite-type tricarboxylate transporter receptor subunit TctC
MKTLKGSGSRTDLRRRDVLAGAAAAVSYLLIRPGKADAANWPDKPITLVIMYAAGGGTDIIMRLLGKEMAAAKGWTVESINKPGAVGGIATNYVLHQPADGYTLLGAANFNKFVRVMGHTTSKQWEDWTTMQAAAAPASWSVRAESSLKSVDDVVKFAKANPGKLTISTSGTGGIWHEVAMQIADKLGIEVQFVPYKGGKPAALAGLQGEVMVAAGGVPEHIELLRAGKMINLFQCGTKDIKLDDGKVLHSIGNLVPATKSILPVGSTYNLMMRRSVPVEIQNEITDAFKKAATSADFKAMAAKKYFELQLLTGEAADKRAAQLETITAFLFNKYREQIGGKVKTAKELGLPAPDDFEKWWPPKGYKPVGA